MGNRKTNFSRPEIDEELSHDKISIYRELKRNTSDRPNQENDKAKQRKLGAEKAMKMNSQMIELIEEKLKIDW